MNRKTLGLFGLLVFAVGSLVSQAQQGIPPQSLGGYDANGNAYAPQNKQSIAAGNWSYLQAQYTNATASFTASGLTIGPVQPGVVIPARCTIFWQSSNIAATVTIGLQSSNSGSTVQVLNTSHSGSNGATLQDSAFSVSGTTQTSISPALTAGTAATTYRDDIDLGIVPGTSGATILTIYGKSSTTTAISFMPGSKCVLGE